MVKKPKNKELATRLGVSDTLVSLVLNNKADQYGIGRETQEKVLALARKMGFFESSADDELFPVIERPGIVGMIVPSFDDPFVLQISQYLEKAFLKIGMGFSIITKDSDDLRFDRHIVTFMRFFSGIILFGDTAEESLINIFRPKKFPFILINVKPFRKSSKKRVSEIISRLHN